MQYTRQQGNAPSQVGNIPFFTYSTAQELNADDTAGRFATYPGGGFVVRLTRQNAAETVQEIKVCVVLFHILLRAQLC